MALASAGMSTAANPNYPAPPGVPTYPRGSRPAEEPFAAWEPQPPGPPGPPVHFWVSLAKGIAWGIGVTVGSLVVWGTLGLMVLGLVAHQLRVGN